MDKLGAAHNARPTRCRFPDIKSLKRGETGLTEDKCRWVKHLPESMLETFARNIVETLYALHGDGVTQPAIDALELMVRAQVPRLISLGEHARLEAKDDWQRLSKSLASGNGYVTQFVDEMQSLVASVIDQIRTSMSEGCDDPSRRSGR